MDDVQKNIHGWYMKLRVAIVFSRWLVSERYEINQSAKLIDSDSKAGRNEIA